MIDLKRHVERIVRPIRASGRRKTRMREELLAHLSSLYEEESASRLADAPAALAAAVDRFGDPAALRAELQGTVPAIERWMFAELASSKRLCRRPGESTTAHVRRNVLWVTGVNALVWILLIGFIAALSRGRPARANETSLAGFIAFAIAYVVLFPVIVHGPVFICDRIRQELQRMPDLARSARRRARVRVAGYTSAVMLVFSGTMGVLMILLNRAIGFPLMTALWFWCILLGWALISLPITALQVAEMRRFEEWGSLELDAAPDAPLSATDA